MTNCKNCGRPLEQAEATCSHCSVKATSPASSLFDKLVEDTKKSAEQPQVKQPVTNHDTQKNKAHVIAENHTKPKKTPPPEKAVHKAQNIDAQSKQKPPIVKRVKKVAFLAVAVVAACLVALYFIGTQAKNDDIQTVDALYEPFSNEDIDALYSNITFPKDTYYEEQAVKKYLGTLNLEEVGQQIEQFMQDADATELIINAPNSEFELFAVTKKDDAFQMTAIAHDVRVMTNVQHALLTIGDKAVELPEQSETVAMVFGIYDTTLKGDMNGFSVAENSELTLPNEEGYVVDASVETYDVQYNAKYPNIVLEVNGKKFESSGDFPRLLKDIPVGTKLEIYGVIEEGAVSYKSDAVKVSDAQTIELQFPAYEEMQQQATDVPFDEHEMYDFASDVVADFLYYYEIGSINDMYTVLNPTSKIFDEHTALMQRLQNNGTTVTVENYTVDHFAEKATGRYELFTTEYFRIEKTSGTNYVEQKTRYTLGFVEGMLYIDSMEIL